MSTNQPERNVDNARELIEAIREGISASNLKGLITLKEWTVAGRYDQGGIVPSVADGRQGK